MCGIVGVYRRKGNGIPRDALLAMAGELRHRGPDGTGLYLDGNLGLIASRLAIVDLARGDQPLSDDEGRFWVVQNGEIYNHVELRRELEERGRRFTTTCDTEVLANAYAEWGDDCLGRLNGDFAFAVWDALSRELFVARDRFGVRPLFMAHFGGDFAFASEAKALLRHPAARRQLDRAALCEFFVTWANPSGRAAFEGITELPPGCSLRVTSRGPEAVRRWWDLEFGETDARDDDELVEELRQLLDDSVRLRMRADVPVAVYASGGLDSSLIAGLARPYAGRGLTLFGIGFEDGRYDEGEYQRATASALDAELIQTSMRRETIAELLPTAVASGERPTLRTAPAPLLQLSASVHAAGTKVVLTGEGADELFAGYDIFREDKVRRFCARQPESKIRPLLYGRLNEYLHQDLRRLTPFLARFYGRGLLETDDVFYSHRIRFENGARLIRTLGLADSGADTGTYLDGLAKRLPPGVHGYAPLDRAQYLEVVTFLEGYLLHGQGDRMLMCHSVEGRFPYLDHRVAEFAATLPSRLRLRGLREKVGLRRVSAGVVPEAVRTRKKWPYRAPIAEPLLSTPGGRSLLELLEPRQVEAAGIFDPRSVANLRAKLDRQDATAVSEVDEMALVGAVSTMLLHEAFVAGRSTAVPAVPTKVVERIESRGLIRHAVVG